MGRIVVMNHVTLDGVMQSPGRPDEDPGAGSRTAVGAAAPRRLATLREMRWARGWQPEAV
jgi:hypothetical protein